VAVLAVCAGLSAALSGACGAVDDDAASCNDGKCDVVTAAPIPGPELLRCFIEPGVESDAGPRIDTLRCMTRAIERIPLTLAADLEVITADLTASRASIAQAEQPVTASSHPATAYPLTVRATLQLFATEQINGARSSLLGPPQLTFSFTVGAADAFTIDHPATLMLPYELWRLTVIAKTSFFARLDPLNVDLSPATSGQATSFAVVGALPLLSAGERATFHIAAPHGQKAISGKGLFGERNLPFSFDSPGAFVAEPAGLRKARPDELPGGPGSLTPRDLSASVMDLAAPPESCDGGC
jgi:hypothetical protein